MIGVRPENSITIQNDSGVDMPARSIVVVTSVEIALTGPGQERIAIHHAVKYTGQQGNIYVTGLTLIPAGPVTTGGTDLLNRSLGSAFTDQFIYASIDPGVAVPVAGEAWGPTPNQWYVTRGGAGGFVAQGFDGTNGAAGIAMFYRAAAVSAVYICTQLNGSANTAIVRIRVPDAGIANPEYATFSAQPFNPMTTTTLAGIDHSLDVDVYSLCLTGVLFTGQVFTVIKGTVLMAIGGDCARMRGTVVSTGAGVVTVTVPYLSNITTSQTCTLVCIDETGTTLTAGQKVIVDLLNAEDTGDVSRFRVAEYSC